MLRHKNFRRSDRSFWVYSESYFVDTRGRSPRFVDEIMVGFYPKGGGTEGEFAVRWIALGGDRTPTPRLEVFEDAWAALAHFDDFLRELHALGDKNPSVQEVKAALIRCGIPDRTERARPA